MCFIIYIPFNNLLISVSSNFSPISVCLAHAIAFAGFIINPAARDSYMLGQYILIFNSNPDIVLRFWYFVIIMIFFARLPPCTGMGNGGNQLFKFSWLSDTPYTSFAAPYLLQHIVKMGMASFVFRGRMKKVPPISGVSIVVIRHKSVWRFENKKVSRTHNDVFPALIRNNNLSRPTP